MDILFILLGGALLFFGGESLVKGSVSIAAKLGLSNLLIAAVVIGFGTSMPEMSVSLKAALDNSPDIVLGNVIGSNVANILLILGVCGLIIPISLSDRSAIKDAFIVVAASLAMCLLAFRGIFDFWAGAAMFTSLLVYIVWSYIADKKKTAAKKALDADPLNEEIEEAASLSGLKATLYCIGGVIMLVGGAWLFIEGSVSIARSFGIPETIIGLSLVAIGTSLPELATSLVAAVKKHGDVIIGNVLGSCLFNILAILATTAMIKPLSVDPRIIEMDMWVMLAASLVIIPFLWTKLKIDRWEAGVMLAAYVGYMGWLFTHLPTA